MNENNNPTQGGQASESYQKSFKEFKIGFLSDERPST